MRDRPRRSPDRTPAAGFRTPTGAPHGGAAGAIGPAHAAKTCSCLPRRLYTGEADVVPKIGAVPHGLAHSRHVRDVVSRQRGSAHRVRGGPADRQVLARDHDPGPGRDVRADHRSHLRRDQPGRPLRPAVHRPRGHRRGLRRRRRRRQGLGLAAHPLAGADRRAAPGRRPDQRPVGRAGRADEHGGRQEPAGGARRRRGVGGLLPLLLDPGRGQRRLRPADGPALGRGDHQQRAPAVRGVGRDRAVQLPHGAGRRADRGCAGGRQHRADQAEPAGHVQRGQAARVPAGGGSSGRRRAPAARRRRGRQDAGRASGRGRADVHRLVRGRHADRAQLPHRLPEADHRRDGRQEPDRGLPARGPGRGRPGRGPLGVRPVRTEVLGLLPGVRRARGARRLPGRADRAGPGAGGRRADPSAARTSGR